MSIFSFGLVQISPHATLGYSRKNPHLHDGRNGGKSHGRGGFWGGGGVVMALEIQMGGGL